MPKIVAVATAVPEFEVDQATVCEIVSNHFSGRLDELKRLLPIFSNAGIKTRYFSRPMDWMIRPHSLEERNRTYIECATDLSAAAANKLIKQNKMSPEDFDYIIYVNTTGLSTPSIDARLINKLGLRRDIHRTPIWGLGCAGGAAGLAHAYRYLLGHPQGKVLLIATELCGLTFLADDYSKSNLVATALFSDGSAAVLLAGDQVDISGLEIIGTKSTFYADSLDVMGWNVVSKGLQVIFARRIPDIVKEKASKDIDDFLSTHSLSLKDISPYLFHPGGTKVLKAYETALNLTNNELAVSWDILSEYGNISSVTVLFILERFMNQNSLSRDCYGLLTALGPGFCSESMLLKV
ncbi:MAG: type III polyketide synthase [candidate division Zixibacteria bacterium]|nr:type III polyketide synthase [candidate division Zixibacteria bacterium]